MTTFIFVLFNVINSIILTSIGYGVDTWQYWVSSICVCGTWVAARCKE